MNELALFAGNGGGILGGKLLGWRTVCAVEVNAYCCRRLLQRQNEGHLSPFPVWDDVCTFDGRPWRGVVDVVSGGFPCQDISAAGTGNGIGGERSGLWLEMARIIGEVRPRFAFVENSPMLTSRGLGAVLGDLAALGYDAEWGVLGAADVGAPHQRDRIWIVAYSTGDDCNARRPESKGQQREARLADGRDGLADTSGERRAEKGQFRLGEPKERTASSGEEVADTDEIGRRRRPWMLGQGRRIEPADGCDDVPHTLSEQYEGESHAGSGQREAKGGSIIWGDWTVEPDVGRVAHGVAARVDRLQALGNGQVPICAAEAWLRLTARFAS